MTVLTLVDEGLGNTTYLVDLGDGRALAVDASRDLRALERAAHARGLRVALAADTHLHADFVTGALDLAARHGARVLAAAAPPGTQRTSTVGAEKVGTALLRARSEEEFVAALLGSLGSYPQYFARLPEVNRRGPAPLDAVTALPALDADQVARLQSAGVVVVDVRPVADVVVRGVDQDPEEVLWQARKIGFDALAGELAGGVDAWRASGRPVATIPLVSPEALTDGAQAGATVLDVRQHAEFRAGHVPGARHLELGDLAGHPDAVPTGAVVVMCGHGERAMGAASQLARAGRRDVAVLAAGPQDWAQATGDRLEVGA
ncbi:MAG: rhodanese-like domain-containing protein [Actinomycetota bacterium]